MHLLQIIIKLEQWIDFLIDFYFQEFGSGFVLSSQQLSSNKPEEHSVISYNEELIADEARISDEDVIVLYIVYGNFEKIIFF